jgi:release factor glutamine methyltransferase
VTVLDKLKELSRLFNKEGISDPAKEASIIVKATLNISTARLHTDPSLIDEKASMQIDSLAARRVRGEPLQYIIGHVDFWGMRICVGKGVLIPRPETELMVEETIKIIIDSGAKRRFTRSEAGQRPEGLGINILDLCTGSGCIALSLAKEFPQTDVYGVDKSAAALVYASRNAEGNGIKNVTFIEGDLFDPMNENARFACIVSNPPYIRKGDIAGLQREISFEPIDALDGGQDGLDFYRRILAEAPRHLAENGTAILEIGFDQANDIRDLAVRAGFRHIRFVRDYSGIARIFVGNLSYE